MALTDIKIRAAKAESGRKLKLSDGGGLQLWVRDTGSKSWNLAYRYDGKQKTLFLGTYPEMTLREAREKRAEAEKTLAEGFDPVVQRQLLRQTAELERRNTFSLVAEELVAKKRREGRAEQTIVKTEWLISLVKADIGNRPIAQISAAEVLNALRKVEARGRLETARRLRAVIGEVFRYAVATQRAQGDPTGALKGALTTPMVKHRAAIIEPKAFGALLRAISGHDGAPEVRIGLELLALTFVRPGELRLAEWTEFDVNSTVWSVPAARTKMRRPHRVPLAPRTVELLAELRKITGDGRYLFPSVRSRARPLSENTFNAALRRLGYSQNDMTSHGFRASASSMLNESGLWHVDAIEAQLAHVEGNAVRKAYARAEYWDERVRMMAWWADYIVALQRGSQNAHLDGDEHEKLG